MNKQPKQKEQIVREAIRLSNADQRETVRKANQMTKKQPDKIEELIYKEINQCCAECGISANVLTCIKKYGSRPKKLCYNTSTYHIGECEMCGERTEVTEARDFFYPDFNLLP